MTDSLDIPASLDRRGSAVAEFRPQEALRQDAKADALIDLAKRLHDWPLLEVAVDHKLAEQEEFIRWWRENVRRPGQGNNAGLDYFSAAQAEQQTGISQPQVSKWAKRLADKDKYRAALFGAAWRKAMVEKGQTDLRGASGTGENEWYTPDEFLVAARDVLGKIDLDPASNAAAQAKVGAARYFTAADDGLTQDWTGRVWLNPPYAQPFIAQFVSKLIEEVGAGRTTAAIMLTHNYTDTDWFQRAAHKADAICFTRGRVKFYNETAIAAPTQGQAFFYFGDDVAAFAKRFRSIGFVVTACPGAADAA